MLNRPENVAFILIGVFLACGFLYILNHFWPPAQRRAHNDVIGWQIAVIGTIYAVMIGFMMFAVWGNFQTADLNADSEANSIVNLFRIAQGLPAVQRDAIQRLAQTYATSMITDEWPAMNEGKSSTASHRIIQQLWSVASNTNATTMSQQTSQNRVLAIMTDLTQHRRLRIFQSHSHLPAILWAVLICGGIITIISCCLIGSENSPIHFSLIFALALLISLTLVAIADIDAPFQGSVVYVSSAAFIRAQKTMTH